MRILIVHHGTLPAPGKSVSGGALRAMQHNRSLTAAGHSTQLLSRAQDQPEGFTSKRDLRRKAEACRPDWILCVALEEAPVLEGIAPLMVDLYAPRLLEACWEEQRTPGMVREAGQLGLQAVQAADELVFTSERQRWFWLGILGLCGWDLCRMPGLLAPLSAPEQPFRPPTSPPYLIFGGQPWPWQDASPVLKEAVALMQGKGEVVVVGMEVAGARNLPFLPYDQWLSLVAGASAALHRFIPNPERELSLSFRELDYLGCGVPIIGMREGGLAEELISWKAGWVEEFLTLAIEQALEGTMREGAQALGQHYRQAGSNLALWKPAFRNRRPSVLGGAVKLARAEAKAQRAEDRAERAEEEVKAKRQEVSALNQQIRALSSSVEACSAAMADLAGFKREVAVVLGSRLGGEQSGRAQAERELAVLQAELEKKNQELASLQRERGRLERVLAFLQGR